jgi:S1-C subfamily serine protease
MAFPTPSAPRWQLKPLGESARAALGRPSVEIGEGGASLGRDPSNTVALTSAAVPQVSSHHARLELAGGRLIVHDLSSTNGTLVNGLRRERAELSSGDILELGEGGPRFAVVLESGLEQTAMIPPTRGTAGAPSLGQTAMISLRKALGLPETGAVDAVVRERFRRLVFVLLLGSLAILGLGLWALFHFQRQYAEDAAVMNRVEVQTARLEELQRELGDDLRARIRESDLRIEAQMQAWVGERSSLTAERVQLEEHINRLEREGSASEGELATLRQHLEQTSQKLERFSPVEMEESKLAEVARVRASVVLIEVQLSFRDRATGKRMFISDDGEGERVNFEDRGELLMRQSTGSGFCVSEKGRILTNAHVVSPPEFKEPLPISEDDALLPEIELAVVFSGESLRRPAKVVHLADQEADDLALIEIEPFEGMPHLGVLEFDAPPPAPGSEVYLYGFPLGTYAIQEGDRVIASTLKGILSRVVGGYLQVDAGVHPGISGGPLTDATGRVLGVVTSVQQTPRGEIAPAIGYVVPIAMARKVFD